MILLVAFLSGLASFLHESIWMRSFGFVLGNSSVSATLVLSAFVGGLGLGGLYLPPRIANRRLGYGLLQFLVAICSALLPWLALHGGIWPGGMGDFVVAFVIVFIPAFLIGGSFPLLFSFSATPLGRKEAAWIYGVNAAGAMLGAAAGPYLGAVALGLEGAGYAASTINAINALLIFSSARKREPGPATALAATSRNLEMEKTAAAALFIAGFATMGFEILAARMLMYYFKGFAIVYAAVIAMFLLGLCGGSFLVARRGSGANAERNLGLALILSAIGCVLPLALTDPIGKANFLLAAGESGAFYARLIGVTALLTLPATLALGASLPLAYEALGGEAAARAGKVAFWNCLGSLLAPLLVGLFLIQQASLAFSFFLVAVPAMALGARLLWRAEGAARHLAWSSAIPALLLLAPGARDNFLQKCWIVRSSPYIDILAHRDGRDFGVSVVEDRLMGERTLLTDAFRAAGTHEDFRYMHGLGSLPLLVHPKPESVCVICFGTGTTAGAVARHQEVKDLRIVEIAPEVMDFAPYFRDRNRDLYPHGALDDRAKVALEDGRRFLRETQERYDVITLEPLLPVTPVAVHFYTQEFYELAKSRLKPGGIVCQWVPTAVVYPQAYRALLETFYDAFPKGTLWALGEVSVLLGGGPEPVEFSRGEWKKRADLPGILSRMGFSNAEELLACCLAQAPSIRPVLQGAEVLHDERPWVEWFGEQSGRDKLFMAVENLQFLLKLGEGPAPGWVSSSARELKFRFLDARLAAANETLLLHEGVPFPYRATLDRLEALVKDGGPPEALRWKRRAAGVNGFREGIAALQQGNYGKALELFTWASVEDPGNSRAWTGRGVAELLQGKTAAARGSLARAFTLYPRLREGFDWQKFSGFLGDLAASSAVIESADLGRKAEEIARDLDPSWERLAEMARSDAPEQELALWAATLRYPFDLRRAIESKVPEDLSPADAKVLAFLLDLFADHELALAAARAWRKSADSSRRESACIFLRDLPGKDGLRDLVELLGDAKLEVRRAAIAALFHRTKQSLDYDFNAEPAAREFAIKRWLAWLEKN